MKRYKKLCKEQKFILIAIIIVFITGSINHFLFDLLGGVGVIAVFSPVNESVFEHMKLGLWPMVASWSLYYVFCHRKNNIDPGLWFGGCFYAIVSSVVIMPLLYYFYTEALLIENMVVDIVLYFFAVAFGQGLGFFYYKYSYGKKASTWGLLILSVLVIFSAFTFFPPKLPMFLDPQTLTYGI